MQIHTNRFILYKFVCLGQQRWQRSSSWVRSSASALLRLRLACARRSMILCVVKMDVPTPTPVKQDVLMWAIFMHGGLGGLRLHFVDLSFCSCHNILVTDHHPNPVDCQKYLRYYSNNFIFLGEGSIRGWMYGRQLHMHSRVWPCMWWRWPDLLQCLQRRMCQCQCEP